MDLTMTEIHKKATWKEVVESLQRVLHSAKFQACSEEEVLKFNFKVHLEMNPRMGAQNDTRGTLSLPSKPGSQALEDSALNDRDVWGDRNSIGDKFLSWLQDGNQIKCKGERIMFQHCDSLSEEEDQMLQRLPWMPPAREEQRRNLLAELDAELSLKSLELGHITGKVDSKDKTSWLFTKEWTPPADQATYKLLFEYEHKLLRIKIGDSNRHLIRHDIVISFGNIRNVISGIDVNEYVIFQLFYPPAYEYTDMMPRHHGGKDFRNRVADFSEGHAAFAPYIFDFKIILTDTIDIDRFQRFCELCALKPAIRISWEEHSKFTVNLGKIADSPWSSKRQRSVATWINGLDFRVAFQCQALLSNSRLTPQQLQSLQSPIDSLLIDGNEAAIVKTALILRYYNSRIREQLLKESFSAHTFFAACCREQDALNLPKPSDSLIYVNHVTVTPTGFRLSGPHLGDSNRVLRAYPDHQQEFLRVDFRDEESLQYRWTPDVNGKEFVTERVGELLKGGLMLCGKKFSFLAYSTSALREHAVWFVSDFRDTWGNLGTGDSIRSDLGDFSRAIACPALFGARMAQAFTATKPTITLKKHQWMKVCDIKKGNYVQSDGVGVMSLDVCQDIWRQLSIAQGQTVDMSKMPSVYQVRIGGHKGVIVLDHQLEGYVIHLRDSMDKFDTPKTKELKVEVARAFVYPTPMYLNRQVIISYDAYLPDMQSRPLIQMLESVTGRPAAHFLQIQQWALDEVAGVKTSVSKFVDLLRFYGLGRSFNVGPTLLELASRVHPGEEKLKPNQLGPFIHNLVDFGAVHAKRALKFQARIPVQDSWNLVGVVDEGWKYMRDPKVTEQGKRVFCLRDREIFAAIRDEAGNVTYLEGEAFITRAPQVHPGDVQHVRAIGKPELAEDEICFFDQLVNCVVFNSVGRKKRPLFNYLGGGDLDGDTYMICFHPYLLLLNAGHTPADYTPPERKTVEGGSTIEDVQEFVVEYINYDVSDLRLGLLSHRHAVIADQSKQGIFDPRCLKLAELCSQAVDFPKTGQRPRVSDAPKRYMPQKPDWSQNETVAKGDLTYYKSDKVLGHLFRAIEVGELPDPNYTPTLSTGNQGIKRISNNLAQLVHAHRPPEFPPMEDIGILYRQYIAELSHIAYTHAFSSDFTVKLREEEIVLGTIMAPSPQPRNRKEKINSLQLSTKELVRLVSSRLGEMEPETEESVLKCNLSRAHYAWRRSVEMTPQFGSFSFGLIALGRIFRALALLHNGLNVDLTGWHGDTFYSGVVEAGGRDE